MSDKNEDAMSDKHEDPMCVDESDFVDIFTTGQLEILWDVERYPVPEDADLCQIYDDFTSLFGETLHILGTVEIILYSAKDFPERYRGLGYITFRHQSGEEIAFDVVKKCVASRDHNVWLVKPPEEGNNPLDSPESVRTNMVPIQGKPMKEKNMMEDFYWPLPRHRGPRAGVFWDEEECPFPDEDRDPDSIYSQIIAGLTDEFIDEADPKISAWAYVDENDEYWKDKVANKTWEASIYFLPRGDKTGRRMFDDILLWIKDTPEEAGDDGFYYPSYLAIISSKVLHKPLMFNFLRFLHLQWIHTVLIKLPSSVVPHLPWPKCVFDDVFLLYKESYGMKCETPKRPLVSEIGQGNPKKANLLSEGLGSKGQS